MGLLTKKRVHSANTTFNPEVKASEVFQQAKTTRELIDSTIAMRRLRSIDMENELAAISQSAGIPILDDFATLCNVIGSALPQSCLTPRNYLAVLATVVVLPTIICLMAPFGDSSRKAAGASTTISSQPSRTEQTAIVKPSVQTSKPIILSQSTPQYSSSCNNSQATGFSSCGASHYTVLPAPSASEKSSSMAALAPTSFATSMDRRQWSSQVAERAEAEQSSAAAHFRYGDSIDKEFQLDKLLRKHANGRLSQTESTNPPNQVESVPTGVQLQ